MTNAAENAITDHDDVSLMDVFGGMGWPAASLVMAWRSRLQPRPGTGGPGQRRRRRGPPRMVFSNSGSAPWGRTQAKLCSTIPWGRTEKAGLRRTRIPEIERCGASGPAGRYQTQGILVEFEALAQAEEERLSDAGRRAAPRRVAAEQRAVQDHRCPEEMSKEILQLFPNCPPKHARPIAIHRAVCSSGRVGREALTQAVIAPVRRRRHTNYGELPACGVDRAHTRQRAAERIENRLFTWRRP